MTETREWIDAIVSGDKFEKYADFFCNEDLRDERVRPSVSIRLRKKQPTQERFKRKIEMGNEKNYTFPFLTYTLPKDDNKTSNIT